MQSSLDSKRFYKYPGVEGSGMPWFLNLANSVFRSSVIGQILLQFSMFYWVSYSSSIISRTWTLVGWSDALSLLNTDGSIPALKTHFWTKFFFLSRPRRVLGSRLGSTCSNDCFVAHVYKYTCVRKVLGKTLLGSFLLECHGFKILQTLFLDLQWLVRSNFQCSTVYHIHLLSLIELERWLAEVTLFPSSTPMAAFQRSRHTSEQCFSSLPGQEGSGVQTRFNV